MKLPDVTQHQTIRALERAGFQRLRKRGSHWILSNGRRPIAVPRSRRKTLQKGTVKHILKQAEMSIEQFTELLKG